jgi:hypothetical protein
MVNFINRMGNALDSACMGVIHAGATVTKGVIRGVITIGEVGSNFMYDIYSLNGFEKFTKAMIANLRMLEMIPSIKGTFELCLKTLEAQKDLYYATLVFGSTADFIKPVYDKTTKEFKCYKFAIPTVNGEDDGPWDWSKLLYGIGNPFETVKFLQKYKILEFPFCSRLATQFGSIKLFTLNNQNWSVDDIPVLNCWCDKPKDFFVFWASVWSAKRCWTDKNFWSVENLVKLTSNIGKIVLISGSNFLISRKYVWTLVAIDVATNDLSLLSLILKCNRERDERFKNPR